MDLRKRYSVVISPPDNIIHIFAQMKQQLSDKHYSSRNSKAHITILNFLANDRELKIIRKKLITICEYERIFEARFDHLYVYDSNALVVLPEQRIKQVIIDLMVRIQQELKYLAGTESNDPHISIGRRLTPTLLANGLQLFQKVDANFYIDALTLRIFNPSKGQYDIMETFPFKDKPRQLTQPDLF